MKKINTIVKSLFLLVLFYGCRNLADVPFPPSEDGNRECKITAEINFPDGNINTLNSIRAAFPASSLKDSDGKTFVFAGALLPSGTEPGSTDLKAALYASGITVSIPFDYSESARSNYVLHIFAYKNDYDSSSGFDIDKALLHGTGTVASIPAGALSLNSVNVYMYPHSYEKGKVSLQVKIPDSTVYNLVTKCDDAVFDNITVVPESNVCTLSVSDVPPKSYSVKFQLVYITPSEVAYEQTEIRNVYPVMKTDKWYKGTSAFSYLDLSAPVKETSFYVCGTFSDYSNSWFHFFKSSDGAEITGNDTTGNGSITKPYATVQKAVDHVLAINDGTSAYTIYVDGNFAAQSGVNYALLADITNIAKTLNLTISSLGTEKSVLKGLDSDGNRIIYCNENSQTVNLTLRNLVFEKGTASNQGGGGAVLFNVSESSKLKIENCVFRQNSHTFGKARNSFQSEIERSGQNDFTHLNRL